MPQPLPSGNPQLPDHINNRDQHPLTDFLLLAAGVLLALVVLVVLLAWSAHWLGPKIPYQWERQWFAGDAGPFSVTADTAADESADAAQAALQSLLDRLLQPQESPLPVTLHWLADDSTPNAFATPGGHIVITRGLVDQVSSENALAMVLAHEYAHIEQRHPAILMLEQLSLALVTAVLGNDVAGSIGQHTGLLTLLAFSRDMERDADARALEILQQHYGHTQGATEFFDKMLEQRDEATWAAMFQTHPLTRERIERITASASGSGALTPLPEVFRTTEVAR